MQAIILHHFCILSDLLVSFTALYPMAEGCSCRRKCRQEQPYKGNIPCYGLIKLRTAHPEGVLFLIVSQGSIAQEWQEVLTVAHGN
jgi:hypothetical protein